jgi:hypothetical protein
MHATITTWTLTPTAGDAGAVPGLFHALVARNLPVALDSGMLDALFLALPPDQVVGIAIYATAADAHAAGAVAAQRVTADFADTLQRTSRTVGQLLTAVLPDEGDLLWRAQVAEMQATWARWRLAPDLRPPGALERFIRDGYERFAPLARQLGLIDMLMIRTAADEVAILNLYADPVAGQAAYAAAVRAVTDFTTGHMERIAVQTGRAFELAMLIGRAA